MSDAANVFEIIATVQKEVGLHVHENTSVPILTKITLATESRMRKRGKRKQKSAPH
jgi:hypothetical protein